MDSQSGAERRARTDPEGLDPSPLPSDEALAQLPTAMVPLEMLLVGDSPRLSGEDEEHVKVLAQTEEPLAPILVHRSTMRIIDGMHRAQAAKLRGDQAIEARLFSGNQEAAFVLGVRVNIKHGLPLTLADRTAAAARILDYYPDWSDRAIAQATGLAAPTVAAIRQRSTAGSARGGARIGRDGRARPLSTAEGRRLAGELIAKNPEASLREIARNAGISPATVRDVRDRLLRGSDPVPPKQQQAEASERLRAGKNQFESERSVPVTVEHPADVVRRLHRDPSLRSNEAGRALLKWLFQHTDALENWPQLLEHLPPHCIAQVLDVAHELAKTWTVIGDELGQRQKQN